MKFDITEKIILKPFLMKKYSHQNFLMPNWYMKILYWRIMEGLN